MGMGINMTHKQPPIDLEQYMHEPAIVCDIDDTIVMEPDYKPIWNVIEFLKNQAQTTKIILLTARLESEREFTVKQMRDLGIPYTEIIMEKFIDVNHGGRATNPHGIWKAEQVRQIMNKYNVVLFIDNSKPARKSVQTLNVRTKKPENIQNNILTKTVWSGIFI